MGNVAAGPLLAQINYPYDLRQLNQNVLPQVCEELRQFIIDTVSINGGHLAAGLGVVELTVALHYVLNTPDDVLVWDVGHQAYGHKILTGRRAIFAQNRKWKGLSGFPKISESEYDAFGTGHSSTSISAVLGMAIASAIQGNVERQHVAVIGDGALGAGMAFEALNHAGGSNANILIILNDNNIGIDPNIGGLQKHLAKYFPNQTMEGNNPIHDFFDSLGIQYFGPKDGHDVIGLCNTLNDLLKIKGSKLLHIKTVKGKGYEPAELNQTKWHATSAFDKITGTSNSENSITSEKLPPKYQDVFGKTILELAKINPKVTGITPAMPSGSSLKFMMDEIPERAFDVGIAEQHAVTLSAGMAAKGLKVFCTVYSTFLQRAYDSIIHDVAIQNLPVIFCIDRAGLVGSDGATHQGAYDIAFLRCIPNMIVSAAMNESEMRNLMFTAQLDSTQQPFAIRYPRGRGVLERWETPFEAIEIGKGRLVSEGEQVAVLSFGHVGNYVQEAISIINREEYIPAHYDMRFAKPLDEALLIEIASKFKQIITVEDGCKAGGFGAAVLAFFNERNIRVPVQILGIPDEVIEQGTQDEQMEYCGYDVYEIMQVIRDNCDSGLL